MAKRRSAAAAISGPPAPRRSAIAAEGRRAAAPSAPRACRLSGILGVHMRRHGSCQAGCPQAAVRQGSGRTARRSRAPRPGLRPAGAGGRGGGERGDRWGRRRRSAGADPPGPAIKGRSKGASHTGRETGAIAPRSGGADPRAATGCGPTTTAAGNGPPSTPGADADGGCRSRPRPRPGAAARRRARMARRLAAPCPRLGPRSAGVAARAGFGAACRLAGPAAALQAPGATFPPQSADVVGSPFQPRRNRGEDRRSQPGVRR